MTVGKVSRQLTVNSRQLKADGLKWFVSLLSTVECGLLTVLLPLLSPS
jgi:hypothetical protein